MHRGYTKAWRKRWDKDYCKDHLLFTMMQYFIDHANYRDTEVFFPNVGAIPLKTGQHIFSAAKIAEKLGVTRQKIRTKLKILKNMNFLTIESTNRYSIASVVNYSIYQSDDFKSTNKLTRGQPAANQQLTSQLTTDKNSKKVKNTSSRKKRDHFSNFNLPTIDETSEASIKKIKTDIEQLVIKIKDVGFFDKADVFTKSMRKQKKNERAILHTLTRCYIKGINDGFKEQKDAWAYCQKVISVENGNYNAQDYEKTKA